MPDMQALSPKAGDIPVLPGRVYEGEAFVKDSHTLQDLRGKLGSYDVVLEQAERRDSGRRGYSFVKFRAKAGPGAAGMMPWRLPAPLSWIDETHVVSLSMSTGVGAGRAETFPMVDGLVVTGIVTRCDDLPRGLTAHRTGFGAPYWQSPAGAIIVQSPETGRMATLGPRGRAGTPLHRRIQRLHDRKPYLGVGAGIVDFNALAQGPSGQQFLGAWQPIAEQLKNEGVSTASIDFTSAQGAFADAFTQLSTAAENLAGSDALAAAQRFVLAGKTGLGAAENIVGLLEHASGLPPSQLVVSFTGTLIGTGAEIAVGAGIITAGIGAAIVGTVTGLLQILASAGLFGSEPQGTTVCPGLTVSGPTSSMSTITSNGPSGALGCAVLVQAQNAPLRVAPGDQTDWRPFPDANNADDRVWFLPMPAVGTSFAWRGVNVTVGPVGSAAIPARPIDAAFPQYRTLQCNDAQVDPSDPTSGFLKAFFAAWRLNAAYALNGLRAQDDADVLRHALRLWNRSHAGDSTTSIAPGSGDLTSYALTCLPGEAMQPIYASLLVTTVRANASTEDASLFDASGNLLVNTGALKYAAQLKPGGGSHQGTGLQNAQIAAEPLSPAGQAAVGAAGALGLVVVGAGGAAIAQGLPVTHYFASAWSAIAARVGGAGEAAAYEASESRRSMVVQSLVFDRSKFDAASARAWARREGFRAGKVDYEKGTLRLRQRSPRGFTVFRTKQLAPGVKATVAR